VIAIVGPLTSFAIAAAVALLALVVPPAPVVDAVMQYLVLVNAVVGVFNLVPGFPLAGGRLPVRGCRSASVVRLLCSHRGPRREAAEGGRR
jgi:Zn-dependent protease